MSRLREKAGVFQACVWAWVYSVCSFFFIFFLGGGIEGLLSSLGLPGFESRQASEIRTLQQTALLANLR